MPTYVDHDSRVMARHGWRPQLHLRVGIPSENVLAIGERYLRPSHITQFEIAPTPEADGAASAANE